jgi:PAS domain S-box-containing protein
MKSDLPISIVSNDTFREIFQSMSEGILIVNEAGKIVAANLVAELMFGYEKNELNDRILEDLLPVRYRSKHVNLRGSFNVNPEPRRMGIGRDLTALRKDGKEFPVEISLSYTKANKQLLVMAFISDISQRKKAEDAVKRSEEQLLVYAAELEHKVQARTEALSKSLEKERELNELKSKFVSIASHEFRTPLSTVLNAASLIQQYKDKGDLEKVDRHIQRIKSSVNHLTLILNDFLSLGKLEEGKIDINKESINLERFLSEISEEMRSSFKEGQQLEILCDHAAEEIFSDQRILRNILFNLISNASKYSEPQKSILLSCSGNQKTTTFSVQDEGIGIPKEDHKHLFDGFFRASNAGNVQGTGLGLNIVKRYTDLLNGNISFSSELGKGSTFIVTLSL